MIKEAKNVDFITTGRQLTEQDFALISDWIKIDKQKKVARKTTKQSSKGSTSPDSGLAKGGLKDR
ncbi:hypothetical protein SAMN05444008_11487 [Cnuella takakiae]|uniref:Uncharacterized protein n=1 Tax=Cnuella takakiae TaxID=1302690 RepID=A0A1M5FPG9_9BACT|nr:hypothetical protein [Cnuella takakiae]OLY93696.1 hypothetical protein BUE76_18775 [Cnuella takakiae]SHF93061.1 hypothetical protein SAMN05444008_11487 [Cnuella takakiae]